MASIVKCRNLSKNQLGGVIFGCTNNTKNECVTKKLFGLPAQHFSYVKNIEPGLPLFLFNYSERKLYGIYEAVSSGKMYIDSYGWTSGGSERTRYPAQVQIRVRLECQALSETLFKPTIVDNYYSQNHFLFELDHVQASKLISELTSLAFAPSVYTPQNSSKLLSAKQRFPLSIQRKETQAPEPPYFKDDFANSRDPFVTLGNSDDSLCLNGYNLLMEASLVNKNAEPEEKDLIHMKLKELARHRQHSAAAITGQSGEVTYMEDVDLEHETHENGMSTSGNRNNESPCHSLDSYATIAQLCQEMEELKAFKQEQTCKMGTLEKKLAEAELEIRRLRKVCMRFESVPETSMTIDASTGNETVVESPDLNELIFLVGGYDGVSWSKALHAFSPVNDVLKSLKPMSTLRSYASVAKLDEELNVFGGGDGSLLYDTVESYNPVNNQWTLRPSLNTKKGHLASATIHGKFFAVGGGNGAECFSDVEMFDSDVGRWISTRSTLQKFTYRKIENKEDSLGNQFSSADPKVFSKNLTRPAKRQRLAYDLNAAYDVDDSCDSDVGQSLTKYSAAAVALADSSEEKKRRENRSKRFEKKHGNHAENSKFKANNVEYGKLYARRASALILSRNVEESGSRAVEDIDWDALTVKGTCQEIEKRYLRLTSAPDPATVRPEEVLEKALLMVQNSQKNYLYKCDQLKSIRQDLTVQHIRNELTVKVYEMHARLSIEVGDLPEYNQCQSQLKLLYAKGIRGCNMEFAAHNLLCVILHSNNNREILSAMSRLSADARKHEAVKHALLVHAAVTSGNYVTFFRLYKTAPNISTYFMDLYVEKMRYAAVKCMCRSYRPTVPISYIAQILSFINALPTTEASDHKEVEGVEECVDWLKTHGACLTSDNSGEVLLDTKASVLSLYMPEPEDAVAHGDASLAVNDFLTQNLA